ncbi:MAG: hypothetical protein [Circular genetic element sp.]|nr:MAG: hypothetical protein [Circular genetic element sp.]
MSYDNPFDRHDLHDPSRERHDDARDYYPGGYTHERKRSDNRQRDHYYDMMDMAEARIRTERNVLKASARRVTAALFTAAMLPGNLPLESYSIYDCFN